MYSVLVALSGGVDSSVAAFLLKKQGFEVSSISFVFYDSDDTSLTHSLIRAQETAEILGIKHSIIDLRDRFRETIITPFFDAYLKGLTPNPCVWCNRFMKFKFLLQEADLRGIDFVSTGHYAIIMDGQLFRAKDVRKDQSYALYRLSCEQLQRVMLPLGCYLKKDIKVIAGELSLPSSEVPESQDVCFLQGRGYYWSIKKRSEGLIIDIETKKRLGNHRGFFNYTIGQRKRLGISASKPLYVVDIDPATNTVYVGDPDLVMKDTLKVVDINWLSVREDTFEATVKIRSTMKDEPAIIRVIDKDEALVKFHQPQWAPAPGQSAVFYNADRVIGGGIITR